MKKCFIGLFAAVLAVSMIGCKGEVESSEKIPAGFVKVKGSTISGGNQFIDTNGSTGVFVNGRTVRLSDFYICNHEVTQAEYEIVMGNNPSFYQGESYPPGSGEKQENRPVEQVSWYDILVYCNKKSLTENLTPCYKLNGKDNPDEWGEIPTTNNVTWNNVICDFSANGYRLPTEAEWEYAARGGKAGCETINPSDWSGTDNNTELEKYSWYKTNSGDKTHEVKKNKITDMDSANELGLYDMSGNVWEWCWDLYDSNITSNDIEYSVDGVVINPIGALTGSYRVIRGGSCLTPANCSVVFRTYYDPSGDFPTYIYYDLGFRVVRSAN